MDSIYTGLALHAIFLVVTKSIVGVLASSGVQGGKESEFKEETKVCVCFVCHVASVMVYHLDYRLLGKERMAEDITSTGLPVLENGVQPCNPFSYPFFLPIFSICNTPHHVHRQIRKRVV